MSVQTRSTGTYGDRYLFRAPAERATKNTGVLWISGVGRGVNDVIANPGTNLSGELDLITHLAQAFTVCVIDAGSNPATNNAQFGTAEALTVAADGRDVLVAAGCDGDIVLVGLSHGFTTAVAYAAVNPANVRGVIGLIPAAHLEDLRLKNVLGVRDSIDAAWGETYPTPLAPSNETTEARAAVLGANDTPVHIYAGTSDGFTSYTDAVQVWFNTYTVAGGLGTLTGISGGNHDNTTLNAIDRYGFRSWIASL